MRTINLVVQQKGGVGKSIFTFLYGEKHKTEKENYGIYDADKKNRSTQRSLGFLSPKIYNFYTDDDINDQAFYEMIEGFSNENLPENILVDCSATVSESLIKTFKNLRTKDLFEYLRSNNMLLNLLVIITGGDTYKATLEYLELLNETLFTTKTESKQLNKHLKITACQNNYKTLDEDTKNRLKTFCLTNNIKLKEFYLTNNRGKGTEEVIKKLMTNGKGLSGLSILVSTQFKKGIEDFQF